MVALGVVGAMSMPPTVVHADDELGWPYNVEGQACIQYDGTILAEGTWQLVWPDEFTGSQGFIIPVEATGTMLLGTPFPCAPRPLVPAIEPPLETAPSQIQRSTPIKFEGELRPTIKEG